MLKTQGQSEKYQGSIPSTSPTVLKKGVFSFCSGGVPQQGSLARIAGKSHKAFPNLGGIISIAEFGKQVVVQSHGGITLYTTRELFPQESQLIYDNEGNLVVDNFGFPVTTA